LLGDQVSDELIVKLCEETRTDTEFCLIENPV